MQVPDGDGGTRAFARDEHPRADTTLEKLASLPVLHPELEKAVVTAGNAAGLNDAAAAVVVTADDYAAAHGLVPLARIVSWASVGVEPERTGLAPTVGHPEGARPRPAWRSATSTCSRSTRRSARWPWRRPGPSASTTTS